MRGAAVTQGMVTVSVTVQGMHGTLGHRLATSLERRAFKRSGVTMTVEGMVEVMVKVAKTVET